MYAMSAVPLVARAGAVQCVEAFLRWLRDEGSASTLLKVPESRIGGPFHACLAEVVARMGLDYAVESCWSRAWFRPDRDAEAYISALGNAHHRKEWRRLERRLGDRGEVAYDVLDAQGDVAAWLDDFAELEAAGWKGRQGTAFSSNPEHLAWLREVGAEAFARRRLMMLALRVDGVPVAIKLNLLAEDGGYAFKIAYDEGLEKFSPGVLLELENIRQLHEPGPFAWMDSLASPRHSLAERVWSDKAAFASMLIAPGRLAGRLVLAARPLLRLAKRAVRGVD
jgi:CelD/BcsL family acetyltransferase involved in cellulose biosynthesis